MAAPKKSFVTPRTTARTWSWVDGLVQIRLSLTKLHRDSERMEVNNLCPVHKTPVGYGPWVCKEHKHTVEGDPLKGYQYEKGSWIILSEEEQAALPKEHDGLIAIKAVIPIGMLDPAMYEGTYLAWPSDEGALKPFSVLQTYARTNGVALVGEGTWWGTNRAIILRWDYVREVMLLSTCAFSSLERRDDVETVKNIDLPEPTSQELQMATRVFDSLPSLYDFSKVTDTVADKQRAIVAEKLKTGTVTIPEASPPPEEVPDLMEALRRTLEEREKVFA